MHAHRQSTDIKAAGDKWLLPKGSIFRVLRNVLLTQHRVDEFLMPGKRGWEKKMNKVKYLICAVT